MTRNNLRGHVSVLAATLAGIVGTELVFTGFMHASLQEISRGVPLLLIGLWWVGRALGQSIALSHARRTHATPPDVRDAHP